MSARKTVFSWMSAALLATAATASAQVQTAGTVYINLDATGATAGAVTGPVANGGSLGTGFEVFGDPQYGVTHGVMGIQFDGDDALALDEIAPSDLNGASSWSIEVWATNTGGFGQGESMVSLWHRAGDGSGSFFWGAQPNWGAFGAWANDLGYRYGAPPQGDWHYLVLTNEGGLGNDIQVYVDGQLNNSRGLAVALREGAEASRPVIGWSVSAAGTAAVPGEGDSGPSFTGTIGRVRVHGGQLTDEQILNNYNEEKADFGITAEPTPTPWPDGTLASSGTLLIDVDATTMAPGVLTSLANGGTLGSTFDAYGDPEVMAYDGVNAIDFDGDDFLALDALSPSEITGTASWTIETWAFNPVVATEESMVNLWHRPNDGAGSLNFSSHASWGAFGAWSNDIGFRPTAPTSSAWHYIVATKDAGIGAKIRIYVDGQLSNARNQSVSFYGGAEASRPALGGNMSEAGLAAEPNPGSGQPYVGALGRVRVLSGSLTDAEVAHNFNEEKVEFGFPEVTPTPTPTPNPTALEVAGEVLVDVDATGMVAGPLSSPVTNNGTLGGTFLLTGNPSIDAIGQRQVNALTFDGTDDGNGVDALGSDFLAPASINGIEDWSIEVWAFNPAVGAEEILVSCWHRPENGAGSFSYGTAPVWGAFGAWDNDLGYAGGQAPEAGVWHHLTLTKAPGENGQITVYVDGLVNNFRNMVVPLREGDSASRVGIGRAAGAAGQFADIEAGQALTGSIAKVRIHSEALSDFQVLSNYYFEKDAFEAINAVEDWFILQ